PAGHRPAPVSRENGRICKPCWRRIIACGAAWPLAGSCGLQIAGAWLSIRGCGPPVRTMAAAGTCQYNQRQGRGTGPMDLGIKGKTALVCAASKGLGKGCAFSLAREGVNVTLVARGREALEATAEEIRKATGVKVTAVATDITTAEGRKQALAACPNPDILVNNAGGPPPGDFREFTHEMWIAALEANMLTPIELIRATVDGMIQRKFGRIVNITSSAVKAPIDVLGLSNGARTG